MAPSWVSMRPVRGKANWSGLIAITRSRLAASNTRAWLTAFRSESVGMRRISFPDGEERHDSRSRIEDAAENEVAPTMRSYPLNARGNLARRSR